MLIPVFVRLPCFALVISAIMKRRWRSLTDGISMILGEHSAVEDPHRIIITVENPLGLILQPAEICLRRIAAWPSRVHVQRLPCRCSYTSKLVFAGFGRGRLTPSCIAHAAVREGCSSRTVVAGGRGGKRPSGCACCASVRPSAACCAWPASCGR